MERIAIVDNPEGNGWRTESRRVITSTAPKIIPEWILKDELRDSCLDLSADLLAVFSASLPFWVLGWMGPFHSLLGLRESEIDFRSEPNLWVARYIVVPAMVEYIKSLPSANSPDPALAIRTVDEALDLAASNNLKITSYLAVSGIDTEHDILTSGDVAVHKLTAIERGELLTRMQAFTTFPTSDLVPYSAGFVSAIPSHMIEVTSSCPRMAQPQPTSSYPRSALCAFYLHGYPLAGPGRMTSDTAPGWISYGRVGTPIQIRAEPTGNRNLDQSELNEILRTMHRLRAYNLWQPANSRDLALHRFFLGSTRDNAIDSLLDYIIALECFFLPYDPATRHSDLGYRFRLHGAHYIGTSFEERRSIWKQLRDLYDIRSRLVHGSHYPAPAEIQSSTQVARSLAERAFLKAVRSHFPRVEEFNDWALG